MITADASMYRSKRSGKNRVTGVPVMDVEAAGRPAADVAAATAAKEPEAAAVGAAAKAAPRAKTSAKRPKGATGDSV
jgi:hypothetical protein